jgi:hypothetical protein
MRVTLAKCPGELKKEQLEGFRAARQPARTFFLPWIFNVPSLGRL